MEITFGGRAVRTFILSHRTTDRKAYWQNILNVVDWSERYGCTGVLLFEGNDTYVSPWLAAHTAIARTERLSPSSR